MALGEVETAMILRAVHEPCDAPNRLTDPVARQLRAHEGVARHAGVAAGKPMAAKGAEGA